MVKAADAVVEPRDGLYLLRYVRLLDAPVDDVWRALTEPDRLAEWLAAARLDLVPDGEVVLHWLNTGPDGEEAIVHGRITALEPPTLLEYATDVHGVLRWELRPDGAGSVLTFSDLSPAPPDALLLVLAGWHIHLDHLEDALDGTPVDWPEWTPRTRAVRSGLSWDDHYARYASRLAR